MISNKSIPSTNRYAFRSRIIRSHNHIIRRTTLQYLSTPSIPGLQCMNGRCYSHRHSRNIWTRCCRSLKNTSPFSMIDGCQATSFVRVASYITNQWSKNVTVSWLTLSHRLIGGWSTRSLPRIETNLNDSTAWVVSKHVAVYWYASLIIVGKPERCEYKMRTGYHVILQTNNFNHIPI